MYNAETVHDFVPMEAHTEWYDFVEKHGDKKVVKTYYGYDYCFPSDNYCNVNVWALLEDGTVIGMNESPRNGWSFPRVGKRAMKTFYGRYAMAEKPKEIEELLES